MSSFIVRPAESADLPEACRLLAEYRPAKRRELQTRAYLAALQNGAVDPAGLLVAVGASGELRGAILAQVLDGAMSVVWPPGVASMLDSSALEDALVRASCRWLRSRGVKIAQWLPRSGDRDGVTSLERQGFKLITRLSMWRRELTTAPPIGPSDSFQFVASHEAADFTATLFATYEESLDCPEAVGTRSLSDLLAAHGSPPSSSEEPLWFVARQEAVAVGVVLLTRGDGEDCGELNYIGVAPFSRSRGVGRELMRFAIARSVEVGFRNLSLSVDVRNELALQLYRSHGFRPYEWRDVYNRELVEGENLF